MTTQTSNAWSPTGGGGSAGAAPGSADTPSVRDRAAEVGETTRNEATGLAQEAKYQARDLVGEARGQVREQVDTQRGRIAELLGAVGDDLEQMADRSDSSGLASDLVRDLAARARNARGYLEDDGDLLGDVRRFARRRPGTFLLGALAAGVLAGRATRSTVAARKQQADQHRGRTFDTEAVSTPGYTGQYAEEYAGHYAGTTATGDAGFGAPGEPLTPSTQSVPGGPMYSAPAPAEHARTRYPAGYEQIGDSIEPADPRDRP